MEFAIGFLSALCLAMTVAVVLVWEKSKFLNRNIDGLYKEVREARVIATEKLDKITSTISDMAIGPITRNIIHLGLKDGRVSTDLASATLSLRPKDFQVNADRLYTELCRQLELKKDYDLSVRAYVILKNAGIEAVLDHDSNRKADKALTRLLINENIEGAKKFLRLLADSVANTTAPTAEPTPEFEKLLVYQRDIK